uniref:Uncharacterized protein n=1 Tax=viral metagenome TaxID=1070528 RepID=A0A6H2A4I9_9ZZZZ
MGAINKLLMEEEKSEKMRTALFSIRYCFNHLDIFKEFRLKSKENKKLLRELTKIIDEAL